MARLLVIREIIIPVNLDHFSPRNFAGVILIVAAVQVRAYFIRLKCHTRTGI